MIGRIVDVESDGHHLSTERGFLVATQSGLEVARIALDDIAALVANAHGLTYSNALLVKLARRGIPAVLCGKDHNPAAIVWPVGGHHLQTGRMADQVAASAPLKKRLWAQLVQAKIRAQGATLAAVGRPHGGFDLLARKVRMGDPTNVEAEAARRYWPLLFGPDFRRDRSSGGINGMLNYGYAVLRAGVARAIMAAGLHPAFGLMHANRADPMVLVDDLMEPFRPRVDREVWRLADIGLFDLDRAAKVALARVMILDLMTDHGVSPVMVCAERLVQSLARAFAGDGDGRLDLPLTRAQGERDCPRQP